MKYIFLLICFICCISCRTVKPDMNNMVRLRDFSNELHNYYAVEYLDTISYSRYLLVTKDGKTTLECIYK